MRTLDDLPAVGADATGTTTLRAHRAGPAAARRSADRLLRAVQAIAISGSLPASRGSARRPPEPAAAGTVTLAIGTASRARAAGSRACRRRRPAAPSSVSCANRGRARRDDRDLGTEPVGRGCGRRDPRRADAAPGGVIRTEIDTAAWSAPDAPLVASERSIRLSNLDIAHPGILRPALQDRRSDRTARRLLRRRLRRGDPLSRRGLRHAGPAGKPSRRLRQRPNHLDPGPERGPRRHFPALPAQAAPAELQGRGKRGRDRGGPPDRQRCAMPARCHGSRAEPLRPLRHIRTEIPTISGGSGGTRTLPPSRPPPFPTCLRQRRCR